MTEREFLLWALKGDAAAVDCVQTIGRALRIWDTQIDRDRELSETEISDGWRGVLTGLPRNPFWRQFQNELVPVLDTVITDWRTANVFEQQDEAKQRIAYVIRDRFTCVAIHCAALIGGHEWALEVSIKAREWVHDEPFPAYVRSIKKWDG